MRRIALTWADCTVHLLLLRAVAIFRGGFPLSRSVVDLQVEVHSARDAVVLGGDVVESSLRN